MSCVLSYVCRARPGSLVFKLNFDFVKLPILELFVEPVKNLKFELNFDLIPVVHKKFNFNLEFNEWTGPMQPNSAFLEAPHG